MKNKLVLLVGLLLPLLSVAQYLPESLGDSVNSAYSEINPVLSPSEDTLYFSRVGHPENRLGRGSNQDVWFSHKMKDGSWSRAKRMPDQFNRGRFNALFSISPDGKQALINGVFTQNGKFYKKRGLSIITRTADGWGKPKKLKVKRLHKMMDGRYFSADMNWEHGVLVMSFSKGINSKRSQLFISHKKKNDQYSQPSRLKQLDASGNEFAPYLSEDAQTLYFSSDRWEARGFEILKAERTSENWKEWSAPTDVLHPVNSMADEIFYKDLSSGVYYSSDTAERGNMDIYLLKK